MIQTGKVVQVCDGGGGLCCLHAAVGGTIQGVAIFVLGPLAGLVAYQIRLTADWAGLDEIPR